MTKIASELRHAITSVSTRSFLNPLLWLCGLISLPSLILCAITTGAIQIGLFLVGLIPLLLIVYLVFKYQDRPELFQSEDYRLRDKALRIYGDSEGRSADELSRIVGPDAAVRLIEHVQDEARS